MKKRNLPKASSCTHDWCGKVATCEPCTDILIDALDDTKKAISDLILKSRARDQYIEDLKKPVGTAKVFVAIEIDNGQLMSDVDSTIDELTEMAEHYPYMDEAPKILKTMKRIREALHVIAE